MMEEDPLGSTWGGNPAAPTGIRRSPTFSPYGTPYGGRPGEPWAGPYSTYQTALVEWISNGTFDGASRGQFVVNESGVVSPS